MRIVLTGGGTGGHIFPIIAVAKNLRKLLEEKGGAEFLFLGPEGELEKEAMNADFIPSKSIYAGKLRRYFSLRYISDICKFPVGFFQSLWHLLVFMPDVIFAKGGYASVPVVLAGWFYRIPVVIHESDITPGLANQISAKFARKIAISFSGTANFFNPLKVFISGNPVREEMTTGSREKAQKFFGIGSDKKIIFILGGSQGARIINESIVHILPKLLKKYEIIHQTGKEDYEKVVHEAGTMGIKAGREGYHVFPFIKDGLPDAYAAADVVVSRAGANSLAEIAANGKPSIIIPIGKSANNHQKLNAFEFSEAGAAVVLEQDNLGENILFEKIEEVAENQKMRYEFGERVKKFHNPNAAEIIAEEIIKAAE